MSSVEEAHRRIDKLEDVIKSVAEDHKKTRVSLDKTQVTLQRNVELTTSMAKNTQDIVDLMRGGKVATRVFLWFVSIAAGVAVLIQYLKDTK